MPTQLSQLVKPGSGHYGKYAVGMFIVGMYLEHFELTIVGVDNLIPTLCHHHSIVVPDEQPVSRRLLCQEVIVMIQPFITHTIKGPSFVAHVTLIQPGLDLRRKMI